MISSKYNMYFNSNDAAVSLLLLPMCCFMVTSSNGNISALLALCAGNSPVTGEFLSQNASDAELWCFLWSAPERTAELTIETVIWDAIALIITSCHCNEKCSKMHEIWATVRLAELLCSKDRFQFYERLVSALQWRHNGRNCVSNHQPYDCLLKRLLRRRPKKTSKLGVTGLCVGKSPVTGEFPAQMSSNAENDSIWWRHHVYHCHTYYPLVTRYMYIEPNSTDTLVEMFENASSSNDW